jgi:hypothetical protein
MAWADEGIEPWGTLRVHISINRAIVEWLFYKRENPVKKIAFLALLPLLAACDDGYTTEADLQGTPITDVCPVDVSEADIANYPACQQ